jgi:hypothetical protein
MIASDLNRSAGKSYKVVSNLPPGQVHMPDLPLRIAKIYTKVKRE